MHSFLFLSGLRISRNSHQIEWQQHKLTALSQSYVNSVHIGPKPFGLSAEYEASPLHVASIILIEPDKQEVVTKYIGVLGKTHEQR